MNKNARYERTRNLCEQYRYALIMLALVRYLADLGKIAKMYKKVPVWASCIPSDPLCITHSIHSRYGSQKGKHWLCIYCKCKKKKMQLALAFRPAHWICQDQKLTLTSIAISRSLWPWRVPCLDWMFEQNCCKSLCGWNNQPSLSMPDWCGQRHYSVNAVHTFRYWFWTVS